jgi:hypothetical protein
MYMILEPILLTYDYTLQPLDVFAWAGASVTLLDVIGALRLALVMRQMREIQQREHLKAGRPKETRGRARDIAATLVMVYGGEAIVGELLPDVLGILLLIVIQPRGLELSPLSCFQAPFLVFSSLRNSS